MVLFKKADILTPMNINEFTVFANRYMDIHIERTCIRFILPESGSDKSAMSTAEVKPETEPPTAGMYYVL